VRGERVDCDALLEKMTLEEKIGQMFMLAFPGKSLDRIRMLIQTHFIGACYLSQENAGSPEEAITLSNSLQECARTSGKGIPLLLAVDHEGVWGVLVPHSTTGPGNLGLGATGDPGNTYHIYRIIGYEMTTVGYNTILAPCADINSNPRNPIIGMRSFGEDPHEVSKHVAAAVLGAHAGGAIATAKHFPGHGDTAIDSHRELPRAERSRGSLWKVDLPPFQAAIEVGVDIVMTSHILFPALDPHRPATLSPIILEGLLRKELGFEGVILSDSMNMKAIRKNYPLDEAVVTAIIAGVDMILLAEEHYDHDPEVYLERQISCIQSVLCAVKKGKVPLDRINQSVRRILALKERYGLFQRPLTPLSCATIVGNPGHRRVESDIAEQTVVLIRDRYGLLPLPVSEKVALVNAAPRNTYDILVSTRGIGPNQAKPAFDFFEATLRELRENVTSFSWEQLQKDLPPELVSARTVVVVTEDYPLPGVDFETATQRDLVERLSVALGERMVVVGLRAPYELTLYPQVSTYLTTCSSRPCAAIAAARVVAGEIRPRGKLPVSIPEVSYERQGSAGARPFCYFGDGGGLSRGSPRGAGTS
jgi:beta-N-acetylhexosaminidase